MVITKVTSKDYGICEFLGNVKFTNVRLDPRETERRIVPEF